MLQGISALNVVLKARTKMANVIITLKIMPSGLDVDLDRISEQIEKLIADFGGNVGRKEKEPVAFGLSALKIMFIMDEKKGSTEVLESKISKIKGVNSVDVVDVRRTIG